MRFLVQSRFERDCTAPIGIGLQHAKRHRDDRGSPGEVLAASNVDRDMRPFPAHGGDHR
jgi:hypothetical protein